MRFDDVTALLRRLLIALNSRHFRFREDAAAMNGLSFPCPALKLHFPYLFLKGLRVSTHRFNLRRIIEIR